MKKIPRERWSRINLKMRLDLYVMNPIRKLSGQKTSSELVAEALEKGVDRKKLDALIEEMEAFASELERQNNSRADLVPSYSQNLPTEVTR